MRKHLCIQNYVISVSCFVHWNRIVSAVFRLGWIQVKFRLVPDQSEDCRFSLAPVNLTVVGVWFLCVLSSSIYFFSIFMEGTPFPLAGFFPSFFLLYPANNTWRILLVHSLSLENEGPSCTYQGSCCELMIILPCIVQWRRLNLWIVLAADIVNNEHPDFIEKFNEFRSFREKLGKLSLELLYVILKSYLSLNVQFRCREDDFRFL